MQTMASSGLARRGAPPPPSLVDDLTGIVTFTTVVEVKPGDPDIFVVAAQTADTSVYGFPTTADISGSGAAASLKDAYWAAVGECAERYSCCILDPHDLVVGSCRELEEKGYAVIPPERWALYDPSQRSQIPFQFFERDTVLAWVKADSLTEATTRLVPASLVYMTGEYLTERGAALVGPAISTGTACGQSRPEALLKGVCEVVERDAFMIMWRNQLPLPRVEIDPSSDLYSLFNDRFARPGLEYNLFYTTLDLGIPSFFGFLRDLRRTPPAIVVGGAAHPDPQRAALKTLYELAQGLMWIDYTGYTPFPIEPEFQNVRGFGQRVNLYANNDMYDAFRFLWQSPRQIALSAIPSLDTGRASDNLRQCCQLIRERGLEIVALDLTPEDLRACNLNVVKVLIPECVPMEGDHRFPFLGGSRWREVPEKLGFQPAGNDALNPYPHPYP